MTNFGSELAKINHWLRSHIPELCLFYSLIIMDGPLHHNCCSSELVLPLDDHAILLLSSTSAEIPV